jgi:hypothetical protein
LKVFLAILVLTTNCFAEERPCEVAFAALNLPAGSDGLLHLRTGKEASTPVQLSVRYFSTRLKVPGSVIQFFAAPVPADADPPPTPLLTLAVPERTRLAYAILWADQDENHKTRWQGSLFNAADWPQGSLKLLNACPDPLGITAGDQKILLLAGKSSNFTSSAWPDSFPVKIHQTTPVMKTVFSSVWRITASRRELCVIFNSGNSVTLRSLMDLQAPPLTKVP